MTPGIPPVQPTVAIVENDDNLRKALKRLLRAHGYQVETYSCAEDFLLRDATIQVDCLVSDIHLDGMSGLDLHRVLRQRGAPPPVAFITGRADKATLAAAVDQGCMAFLHKPIESQVLTRAIQRICNRDGWSSGMQPLIA